MKATSKRWKKRLRGSKADFSATVAGKFLKDSIGNFWATVAGMCGVCTQSAASAIQPRRRRVFTACPPAFPQVFQNFGGFPSVFHKRHFYPPPRVLFPFFHPAGHFSKFNTLVVHLFSNFPGRFKFCFVSPALKTPLSLPFIRFFTGFSGFPHHPGFSTALLQSFPKQPVCTLKNLIFKGFRGVCERFLLKTPPPHPQFFHRRKKPENE